MDAIEKKVILKIIQLSKRYRKDGGNFSEALAEIEKICDDVWNDRYKSKVKKSKKKVKAISSEQIIEDLIEE